MLSNHHQMDLASLGGGSNGDADTYSMLNDYYEIPTLYEPTYESSISVASFDSCQELFWTGNNESRVSSFYSMSLEKYSSFKVQSDVDIRGIYPHFSNDIFILTSDSLACYSKLGYQVFKHSEVSFSNLQCLFYHQQQQRFLLGGFGDFIYDFDIDRLRILRQISISDEQTDCILVKSSQGQAVGGASSGPSRSGLICTGSSNGQIILRDPATLKSTHKFHPHSGCLSDFDVNGNMLVSCGFAMTRSGLQVDRFLMCYDLRMMRALNPMQMLIEPCYVHFLPICSSVVAVASQSGCFLMTDTSLMNTPSNIYQAQLPPISGIATTFSVSSNCQAFAFGHSSGSVHLFTKGQNSLFNDYPEPTVFVDPPPFTAPFIDINDEMSSLSSVPVPVTFETVHISDWPLDTNSKYRPTPQLNTDLMENARVINGIMSVPNRVGIKRNQVFNETYRKHLSDLDEKSAKTSYGLSSLLADLTQAQEEKQKQKEAEATTKEATDDKSNGEVVDCESKEADKKEEAAENASETS